jgi:hypothetical protein
VRRNTKENNKNKTEFKIELGFLVFFFIKRRKWASNI